MRILTRETEKIRRELEAERKLSRSLKEEVFDEKLERSLLEDRHKAQMKETEFKADRKAQEARHNTLRPSSRTTRKSETHRCILVYGFSES